MSRERLVRGAQDACAQVGGGGGQVDAHVPSLPYLRAQPPRKRTESARPAPLARRASVAVSPGPRRHRWRAARTLIVPPGPVAAVIRASHLPRGRSCARRRCRTRPRRHPRPVRRAGGRPLLRWRRPSQRAARRRFRRPPRRLVHLLIHGLDRRRQARRELRRNLSGSTRRLGSRHSLTNRLSPVPASAVPGRRTART